MQCAYLNNILEAQGTDTLIFHSFDSQMIASDNLLNKVQEICCPPVLLI